jgi:hypothetical protein
MTVAHPRQAGKVKSPALSHKLRQGWGMCRAKVYSSDLDPARAPALAQLFNTSASPAVASPATSR